MPRLAWGGARCALAATLTFALFASSAPRRASAHANGTLFSSAVDGDGASLFWNPAAMALTTTSRFDLVANFSLPQASYQRYGIDEAQTGRPYPRVSLVSVRPEPHLGLVIDKLWHERMRIGVSLTVPSAVGAAWPETVKDHGDQILGPTRYHVTRAQIFHVYGQLGASFVVHRTLALGVSLNLVLSRLDVHKHLDLANQGVVRDAVPCAQDALGCENPGASAPLNLSGWGFSAGASVGALWQPIDRLRVGIGYISPAKVPVALSIGVDAKQLEAFARQFLPGYGVIALNGSGTAHVTVPQRLHLAVAFDVHPRLELMALARWVNYAATEIISGTVATKSSSVLPDSLSIPSVRNNEWTLILRAVGRVTDTTRVGFSLEYVTKTVPDAYMTPANLDFDLFTFSLAASGRVWHEVYLGGSFAQSAVIPRSITHSAFSSASPAPYSLPDPTGRYTANSEKLGLDVSARF